MSKTVRKVEKIYHSDTLAKVGSRVKMCIAKEIYEKSNTRKIRIGGAKNVKKPQQRRKPFFISTGADDKIQTNFSWNYAETAGQRTKPN